MKKFIFLYLVLFSGLLGNSQVSFIVDENLSKIDLVPYLEIHEDKTSSLGIKEIETKKFSPIQKRNQGYTTSNFWLKWRVENPTDESQELLLVFKSNLLDRIELFKEGSAEPLEILGDRVPYGKRIIDYRHPVFKFHLESKEKGTYYFKIGSESTIPIEVEAYSTESFFSFISNEQIIYGFYFGWMLVMVFYNLFLYISTRIKSYAFYVLFIFSYGMFQFILNGYAYQYLWPGSEYLANQAVLVFMTLSTLTGLLFSTHFLKARQTLSWVYRLYQVLWALGGIIFVLSFIINYTWTIRICTYYAGLSAILLLLNGVLAYKRKIRTAKVFLSATSVLIVGVLLFTFKSMGWLPSNALTNWTIQIGSALLVVLFSFGLADRIKELSSDLKKRVEEFGIVNAKLSSSDNRFRQLFHGVSDVIFVLDENWNFIDVNRSVTKHLGFKPDEIKGKNILEMVYKSRDLKNTYNRIFVMEKLEELHDKGQPVDFQAEFQQKFVMEPKELLIKLQHVQLEDKKEILGTASVMVEDILGRYLQTERITFNMDNYLRNAEIMSNKLTAHIQKFSDINTLLAVRTSLREIIINAIEHGNLNISFHEKSEAMMEGNYLQFIQNRQNDPRYKDKKITIEYVLDSKKVAYRITDEGKGFDHKKMMDTKMEQLNEENIQHGRGIMMTRDIFDIVEYNEKGNQVSLVKYFR